MKYMPVSELVAAFDGYLGMRRSEGTRRKYGMHVRDFAAWVADRPLEEIDAQAIEFDYLGPWAAGVTPATLRNRISALRAFFAFCERFDYIDRNPMRRIESPERDDKMGPWLRPEQDLAMQDAIVSPVERAVVTLLRYTGLRVSEACALRWSDLDIDAGTLKVEKSKTKSGRRTIPLPATLIPQLRAWQRYLEARGMYAPGGFVLATKNGTGMAPQFVWRVVKRVGERAGLDVSPHTLRRTYGSALINNECRLEVVSKALGHANTTVTEKSYAELTAERIASEVLAAMA
jgi:site-specific recombinase XerD